MNRSTFPRRQRALLSRITASALLAAAFVVPTVSAAGAYPTFRFSGAGYGHGIGLSQYGARGYAATGRSGAWIVSHYFPGTALAKPASKTVRVNLDPAAEYTSSSDAHNAGFTATSWRIRAGWSGMGIALNAGATLPDSRSPYSFKVSSGKVAVSDKDGKAVAGSPFSGTVVVTMAGTKSPALLQVVGRSGPFKVSSAASSTDIRYRGELLVSTDGSRLKLLNRLPMESYLYGVVPRESPATWHKEALKAQSIVARSYAYAGNSELYCNTRSQMYNGHSRGARTDPVAHEYSQTNDAVKSTAGTCVTYGGEVVSTYFSASSGGYTANKVDVWGGSEIAYLKGVPDPYGKGSFDPWASQPTLDGMELAARIAPRITGEPSGAGGSVYVSSLDIDHAWPTGFARSVRVKWSDGTTDEVGASTWKSALGLPSTKFYSNAYGNRVGNSTASARSVAASKIAFSAASESDCVIVVNADDGRFTNAVLGAAFSGVARGPVLLVHEKSVPSAVASEIKRLRPRKAYIIGSTASVSTTVARKVAALGPSVVRLSGKDRYETSAVVARKARALGASSTRAVIVSDESYRTGAVAAAIAGGSKRPLLMTAKGSLSSPVARALDDLRITATYVVGPESTISTSTIASVVARTGESAPVRWFGRSGDTYELAVEGAEYALDSLGFAPTTVFAPSRYSMPDAVISAGLSSATKRPFVYASTYTPPDATVGFLSAHRSGIKKVTVVGKRTTVGLAPAMELRSVAY